MENIDNKIETQDSYVESTFEYLNHIQEATEEFRIEFMSQFNNKIVEI